MSSFFIKVFLISLIAAPICAQKIALDGVVFLHNSKYQSGTLKGIADAYINADFATPTQSDAQGKFQLMFQGITKGSNVELRVEKSKLEVVNQREILEVVLGRTTPLKVYLAPKGQIARAQTELLEISMQALTSEHEELIRQLRKGEQESQALIKKLEKQWNRSIQDRFEAEELLNQQLAETKKRLPELVKKRARINLDFASQEYQAAYEIYKKGDLKGVLSILEDSIIAKKSASVYSKLAELEKDQVAYRTVSEQAQEEIDQVIQAYTLKTDAFNLLFDYRSALEVYQKVVDLMEETKLREDLELADAYETLSEAYSSVGNYREALNLQGKCLRIKGQLLNKPNLELGYSYQWVSELYDKLGAYAEALEYQQKAIEIAQSLAPDNLQIDLSAHLALAKIHMNLGADKEAVKYGDYILQKLRERKSLDRESLIAIYSTLTLIYTTVGKFERALVVGQGAVQLIEQDLSSTPPEYQAVYNNLMMTLIGLGAYEDAIKLGGDALKNLSGVVDDQHPFFAYLYNNLGTAYSKLPQPQHQQAIDYYHKALDILRLTFSDYHPFMPISYNNLAESYMHLEEYERADSLINLGITLIKENDQGNVDDLAASYIMLSMLYYEANDQYQALQAIGEAEALIQRIPQKNDLLESEFYIAKTRVLILTKDWRSVVQNGQKAEFLYDQLYGPGHPARKELYETLFNAQKYLQRFQDALLYARKLVQWSEVYYEPDSPEIGVAYRHLCDAHNNLNDFEAAVQAGQKALALFQDDYYTEHPEKATIYHTLAYSYFGQQNFEKAYDFQEKAVKIYRQVLEPGDPNLRIALGHLEDLKRIRAENPAPNPISLSVDNPLEAKLEDLLAFKDQNPDLPSAYYNVGIGFYYNQDLQIANLYLDRGRKRDSLSPPEYLLYKALIFAKLKKSEEYARFLEELGKARDSQYLYVGAVRHAVEKNTDLCLEKIEAAIHAGFKDWGMLEKENAFTFLAEHPQFQLLVKQMRE